MYIVVDKNDKTNVVHVNRAPLKQNLEGVNVYSKYDVEKHIIVPYEGPELKEFTIDESNQLVVTPFVQEVPVQNDIVKTADMIDYETARATLIKEKCTAMGFTGAAALCDTRIAELNTEKNGI